MKTIRARLVLPLVILGGVLLAASAIAVYFHTRFLLTAQYDDGLRARSQAIISLLDWQERGVKLDYKGEYMPEFEQRHGGFFFQVWVEESDRLLERSHSLQGTDLPRFAGTVGAPAFRSFTLDGEYPARAVGVRVGRVVERENGESFADAPHVSTNAGAVIVVAGETTALEGRLHRLAVELVSIGIICLAFIPWIVRVVLRRGLQPLNEFSHFASGLDASSLDQRFPMRNLPDELGPIAARLNILLARLEQAFSRERRFSANVAHELRTPIAELLSLAEVGVRLAGKDATRSAFFADAADIARRMSATVASLLLLARCESGRQLIDLVPVELGELLEDLCRTAAGESGRQDLTIQCTVPARVIKTDPAMFTRLCQILMSNALAYTAAGGRVEITGTQEEVLIRNGPVTLDSADLPLLFERFWRKDEARTDAQHSGLGLALAAELARLLGLKLQAELMADKTFQMRIRPSA